MCAGIGSSSVHAWIILLAKFLFIPCYTYCKKNLIPVKFPSFLLYIQSPQLLSVVNLFLVFFFLANLPKHMHNNLALFHSEMATGLCQSLVADTFLARGNIRLQSVICWMKTIQKWRCPAEMGDNRWALREVTLPSLPLHFLSLQLWVSYHAEIKFLRQIASSRYSLFLCRFVIKTSSLFTPIAKLFCELQFQMLHSLRPFRPIKSVSHRGLLCELTADTVQFSCGQKG